MVYSGLSLHLYEQYLFHLLWLCYHGMYMYCTLNLMHVLNCAYSRSTFHDALGTTQPVYVSPSYPFGA